MLVCIQSLKLPSGKPGVSHFLMSFTIKRLKNYPLASVCSWGRLRTPYGVVWLVFCEKKLCFLGFAHDEAEDLWPKIHRPIPRTHQALQPSEMHAKWHAIERAWLEGGDLPFELATQASDFEYSVWTRLREIPLGQTVSYSWVAERVGSPQAVRAVASAIGRNPFSVLIPCHRVIAKNGSLGGYAWGLSCKQALLGAEKSNCSGLL